MSGLPRDAERDRLVKERARLRAEVAMLRAHDDQREEQMNRVVRDLLKNDDPLAFPHAIDAARSPAEVSQLWEGLTHEGRVFLLQAAATTMLAAFTREFQRMADKPIRGVDPDSAFEGGAGGC